MGVTPNLSLWLAEEGATTIRQLYNDNFTVLDTVLAANHIHVDNHEPAELVAGVTDGVVTNFSTSSSELMIADSSKVFLDNARQREGTDYNEDGDLKGITFTFTPPAGMTLVIDYRMAV